MKKQIRWTLMSVIGLLAFFIIATIIFNHACGKRQLQKCITFACYEHPMELFKFYYPENWKLIKEIDNDIVKYTATPQLDKNKIDDLTVFSQLSMISCGENNILTEINAEQALNLLLPAIRQAEPLLLPVGNITPSAIGGIPSAKLTLTGELKEKEGIFTGNVYVAINNNFFIILLNAAPKEQFAKYDECFSKITAKVSFFCTKNPPRKEPAFAISDIAEKYKNSVVSIRTYRDNQGLVTGSGFVIRKDGYIITNHHVVWDSEKNQPGTRFTVEWDDKLKIPKQEAVLVDYRRVESPLLLVNWGIDIALLKIPADREYDAIPVTPLSDVKLGDQIITMGFPARGEALQNLETLSLVITSGVVTRFNTNLKGIVESLYIDAPFAHGSSGGPCINLATGGVVGLNTYGIDVSVAKFLPGSENLINYHGVILSDYILNEFPITARLSADEEEKLDYIDYFDIALFCIHQKAFMAAEHMIQKSIELKNDISSSFCMRGVLQLITANTEEEINAGIDSLKTALQIDPKNISAMIHLAETLMSFNKIDEAKEYINKAILADPLNWRPYLTRAKIEKYDEALKDLDLAKKYSFNLAPEPYILTGNIFYAENELEKGKKSFEDAVKIYPLNIDARLGIARYFMLKKDYLSAILEYSKILNDFPQAPQALFAAAQCYQDLNKAEKAFEFYDDAINKYLKVLQKSAPKEVYLSAGALAVKEKNIDLTFIFLLQYLQNYFNSPESAVVHKTLAAVILGNDYSKAIAKGHLLCAYIMNDKDEQVKKQLQELKEILMTMDDIKLMLKVGYPGIVAGEIVSVTPLDFAITTEEELQKIAEEVPEIVIKGILVSNELYKNKQGEQAAQPEYPDQTPENVAINQWMIGRWKSNYLTANDGRQIQIEYTLNANNRFYSVCRELGLTDSGTYTIRYQYITFISENGTVQNVKYFISGQQIYIELPGFGYVIFNRQK